MHQSPIRRIAGIAIVVLFAVQPIQAQLKKLRYVEKKFQFSFFPGMSTNGLESAMYFNKYSFNLTSGISAGNHYFELGVISNTHTRASGGIQVAGFANIVGANSYVNLTNYEEKEVIKAGDTPELKGIQLAGLLNFVRNNATGFQLTGGFNVNMGNASVIQFAGISNTTGISLSGVQVAGLYNEVRRSATGVQISALYNSARGNLDGLQLGAINRTYRMSGPNSLLNTTDIGIQIGLVNFSKINDGLQIGLINKTKQFRGMQIGLVNFLRTSPYNGTQGKGKYGIPIGLLNIGSKGGHKRLYLNDFFLTNMEITTGNCYNCTKTESQMPLSSKFQVYYQNALIVGYDYKDTGSGEFTWSVGYGLHRMMYNKSSMNPHDPKNKKMFISYGLRFLHLNREDRYDGKVNLLTKAHSEIGLRVTRGSYLFAGVSMNYYTHGDGAQLTRPFELASGSSGGGNYQIWSSYTVGIQI